MRSLIIQYREAQSWNDIGVSSPAGTPLKMMLVSISGDKVEILKKMVMSNRRITVEDLLKKFQYYMGLVMLFYVTI